MLVKEYRIPLPLTVDEYRIAQLYMIAVSVEGQALSNASTASRSAAAICTVSDSHPAFRSVFFFADI